MHVFIPLLALIATSPPVAPPHDPPSVRLPEGTPATLTALIEDAVARSPSLLQARLQATGAFHRIRSARGLDDARAKLDIWNVPLDQPLSFGKADTIMLGLRRMFPPWKKRNLKATVALREFEVATESIRTIAEELRKSVKKAYADFFRAHGQILVQLRHLSLARAELDLTQAQHEAGLRSQADLMRASAEVSMRQRSLPPLQATMDAARALINTLRYRPARDPLGPPVAPRIGRYRASDLPSLVQRSIAKRSELVSSRKVLERDEAATALARVEAKRPDIELGGDYWLNPESQDKRHGYQAMVSISLPWLNPRHQTEIREAEATREASLQALNVLEAQVAYEVTQFHALQGGKEGEIRVLRDLEIPQLEAAVQAARVAYEAGTSSYIDLIDARRRLQDAQLAEVSALAEYEAAIADLERAVGAPLEPR